MRFGFRLSRLSGAVHSGGNVAFSPDGNTLYSIVHNRVTSFDLVAHACSTLPYEHTHPIRRLALSPDGRLLLSVDSEGYLLLIHLLRKIVLCRMRLKRTKRVRDLAFSPDGRYFAMTQERHFQVWQTPGAAREFAPFVLYRTYGAHADDILSLAWSPCGKFLVTGSKDLTVKVWSLDPTPGFVPATLSGHRDRVVRAFFGPAPNTPPSISIPSTPTIDINGGGDGGLTASITDNAPAAIGGGGGGVTNGGGVASVGGIGVGGGGVAALLVYSLARDGFLYCWELDEGAGAWRCRDRQAFKKARRALLASAEYHPSSGLLVCGFSDGVFGLYELPDCTVVHTLSVSHGGLGTVALNKTGEWLALGCGPLGQLLVWEWQSETYVLKQQGHADSVACVAFSPDGQTVVTGGDDAKVKLWSSASGFSYATFTAHEAPVTGLAFLGSGQAILSSSLDGTVRAHDLLRYRNFRTLTTPSPTQLMSLAVDPSGEVVCAGSAEPFEVYVWALQTGKLLEVLPGHGGPVVALDFSPTEPILASGSWDGTVKMWNVYKKELIETHSHTADVLAVAFRPDGKELCVATLNGRLHFWDVQEGLELGSIDGRRDIAGGRGLRDKVTAETSSATKHFSSVAYSADGSCVIAGGRSKFVCIYHVPSKQLLRKFQLSHDRTLDGVLDKLHSGRLGPDGQPLDGIDADDSEDEGGRYRDPTDLLPGAKRAADGSARTTRPEVRSSCVRFSPTGREWAAATPQGLLVYALEEDMVFNPIELDEAATPAAVDRRIASGEFAVAITMAAQLNEEPIILKALEAAPPTPQALTLLARTLPATLAPRLLQLIAKRLGQSPHLAFLLQWALALLQAHGPAFQKDPAKHVPSLRALQRSILRVQDDIGKFADENQATLDLLALTPLAEENEGAGDGMEGIEENGDGRGGGPAL